MRKRFVIFSLTIAVLCSFSCSRNEAIDHPILSNGITELEMLDSALKIPAGQVNRSSLAFNGLDFLSTVFNYAGISGKSDPRGRSLGPLFEGNKDPYETGHYTQQAAHNKKLNEMRKQFNQEWYPGQEGIDFSHFPSIAISNDQVKMKIYLPDPEKGLYRATRFDWSGVIGSVQYKGHEYFGYWKETHDPLFHEDLTGPVEGFIEPGFGYEEAKPGEGFVRLGVGVLEKEDESEYDWMKTYKILDHGEWAINHGKDWITFTHKIQTEFGYAYTYTKTIKLVNAGFVINHSLQNQGEKAIETDQFNHNFFMIDGKKSGTAFQLSFPYEIRSGDDPKDYVELKGKDLTFINDIEKGDHVFLSLEGYGEEVKDHHVKVINRESGAGVSFSVDKPLHRMVFWACETTLSPENFIWISVKPGETDTWSSEYNLFVE